MSDSAEKGHLKMAKDLFGKWDLKTHKMEQLKNLAKDWGKKFMKLVVYSFCVGYPIHLKSPEMHKELLNYKEWVDFIPTKGVGICLKFDADAWILGEICCRLEYYKENADELKEIEDEISNACLGDKLVDFVEGMCLLIFLWHKFFYVSYEYV